MFKKILRATALLIFLNYAQFCFGQETGQSIFSGAVNSENINVRSDANTNSKIICKLSKSEVVEIVLEKFDWYKIRLPKTAECFAKKSLFTPLDEKTAKASGNNINIRQEPSESSVILGRIQEGEIVFIAAADNPEWYKITPTNNTFGWVHKKFLNKTTALPKPQEPPKKEAIKEQAKPKIEKTTKEEEIIVVEGLLHPYGKVLKRQATHKLITKEYDTYLLKGSFENLNSLTYHKVRITAKLIDPKKQKIPLLEVIKIEDLD